MKTSTIRIRIVHMCDGAQSVAWTFKKLENSNLFSIESSSFNIAFVKAFFTLCILFAVLTVLFLLEKRTRENLYQSDRSTDRSECEKLFHSTKLFKIKFKVTSAPFACRLPSKSLRLTRYTKCCTVHTHYKCICTCAFSRSLFTVCRYFEISFWIFAILHAHINI